MGDVSPQEASSETVIFRPLKFQRSEAIAVIMGEARALGLHVDSIRERPRLFSIDLRVKLTGDAKQIESFYRTAGGRGEGEPSGLRRGRWLAGIRDGIGSGW